MLGTTLDIVASLINHSCDPNVFVVFEGNSLRVRPIRKLVAGEELTQCYTDVNMDVSMRRLRLKVEYIFFCRCECVIQHSDIDAISSQVVDARTRCGYTRNDSLA
jgi:SET domain-containing protein